MSALLSQGRLSRVLKWSLFLLPVLPILLQAGGFPFSPGAEFSDLAISHYPNMLFLRQSLVEQHAVPLWSPLILSGTPFVANPLSGLHYPPGWLALLFPLPLGFNLLVAAHLVLGGVGLYLFLRRAGLGEGAALFGGLAFEAMPKLYAHLAAGHITLLYAVCLTPWLFLAEEFAANRRGGLRHTFSGGVLAVIALADIRWAAYAGIAWAAYLIFTTARKADLPWNQRGVSAVMRLFTNSVMALAGSAPLLVPLLEYSRLSTRAAISPAENLFLSLPFGQALGIVYPFLRGPAEWMIYPGGAAVALLLFGVAVRSIRSRAAFWLGLMAGSLLFSFGANLPFGYLLARFPGLDMLRVPPRALFLFGLGAAVTGAEIVDHLMRSLDERPSGQAPRMVLFGFTLLASLLGIFIAFSVPEAPLRLQFAWGTAALLAASALVFLRSAGKISPGMLFLALLSATLVDLNGVNLLGLEFRPAQAVLAENALVGQALAGFGQSSAFRVYSPSYSVPQHIAAVYRLELADGVDPLQLEAYAKFMEGATGVKAEGYSVTIPPFAEGDPATDNQGAVPDSNALGLLNVGVVVSAYPIEVDGLTLMEQVDGNYLYRNNEAMPRAWMQDGSQSAGTSAWLVQSVEVRPNEVNLTAEGPGLLVLSEINYPGWFAWVDGQPVQIRPAAGILRSVPLGAGRHQVRFVFSPLSLWAGLAAGCTAWIIFILDLISGRTGRINHAS